MSENVTASHILLMYKGSLRSKSDRTRQEAEQQIKEIKSQLDNGADFGALAREYSDCPSSQKGGDLGTFSKGQMVKPFEETAFTLGVGMTSDVVQTDFGYHIIRRTA